MRLQQVQETLGLVFAASLSPPPQNQERVGEDPLVGSLEVAL
jgi:hypothetical protein